MDAAAKGTTVHKAQHDNADPRELAHYEQLAASWWDLDGPFWPLHRLNALRAEYLRQVITTAFGRDPHDPHPLHGIQILDVGCGGGVLSESMAKLGARVHGIDLVEKSIAIARCHAADAQLCLRYETVSISALRQREVNYDVVLNMEVVEHVPDVDTFVADCASLLRPGGLMALATINRTLLSWLFAIVGAEYVLRWLPRGTHRWRQFVRPVELQRLAEAGGLRISDRIGVRVNPLTRHFALTGWMAVNYMLVARRDGHFSAQNAPAALPAGTQK